LKDDFLDNFNGLRYPAGMRGRGHVWEHEKLEARKIPVKRARPTGSPTRQVIAVLGALLLCKTLLLKKFALTQE
jgi:hypothetical protein